MVITVLNCCLYVLSVLQSWEYGWCLLAPGTKVIACDTLLQHVTAETEMYGRAVHKFLCHWICNCCKCCCRKQVGGGGGRTSAERLSLLAGLVDAQWFTVFGSAGSFLTLTNACVMEAGPYSCCPTLQVLLPRGDPSALKKQQHVRN